MAKVKKVRKTPGKKIKIIKVRKQPKKSHCSLCGAVLHGVKRGTSSGPKRPYGGELCSKCTRKVLSLKAKIKNKEIKKEDVPFSIRKYL